MKPKDAVTSLLLATVSAADVVVVCDVTAGDVTTDVDDDKDDGVALEITEVWTLFVTGNATHTHTQTPTHVILCCQ